MKTRGRPPHPDVLTDREWEVYYLLRMGLTNQEIGDWLGISFRGAKFHVSEIITKLGVESRRDLRTMDLEPRVVRLRRANGLPSVAPASLSVRLTPAIGRLLIAAAVVLVPLVAISSVLGGHPNAYVLPAMVAVSFGLLSLLALSADAGVSFMRRHMH